MALIADTVFPHLGLPGWTVTLVIALVVLGFPLAAAARRRPKWVYAAAASAVIAALLLAREWLGDRVTRARLLVIDGGHLFLAAQALHCIRGDP